MILVSQTDLWDVTLKEAKKLLDARRHEIARDTAEKKEREGRERRLAESGASMVEATSKKLER
jgi:ribosomal protein L7/L12